MKLIYQKHLQQFEQHSAARDPDGEVPGQLEALMLRNACNQPSELGDAEAARVLGGMLVASAKPGPSSGATGDEQEPPNKRRRLQQARSSAVLTPNSYHPMHKPGNVRRRERTQHCGVVLQPAHCGPPPLAGDGLD